MIYESHTFIFTFLILSMNIGTALHELSVDDKRTVRSLESTSRKLINAKASVVFNEQCIICSLHKISCIVQDKSRKLVTYFFIPTVGIEKSVAEVNQICNLHIH